MKFDKAAAKVKQVKMLSGLFEAIFEHEVKSSTATFKYNGPMIDPEEWQRVLAFLKYSYDKTHSESQLRLFVNPKLGWRAWAFPQICGTGMTTKEVEEASPARDKQRAQFKESEGWIPFGTVHHHCSTGAFQSGTDENDEISQDGLHITIGKLNEKHYDIHCRFYLGGNRFEPDMSLFYKTPDVREEVPKWAQRYLPASLSNEVARLLMTTPAPEGTVFPEEWKENLVERKPTPVTNVYSSNGFFSGYGSSGFSGGDCSGDQAMVRRGGGAFQTRINTKWDLENAAKYVFEDLGKHAKDIEQMAQMFEDAVDFCDQAKSTWNVPLEEIINFCHGTDVSLEKFAIHLRVLSNKKEERKGKGRGKNGKADPAEPPKPIEPPAPVTPPRPVSVPVACPMDDQNITGY